LSLLKAVIDTNILVSSLLTSGPPAVIADLVADKKIIPFYSVLILEEYHDVLLRKKFNFNPTQVNRLIDDIVRVGFAVEGKPSVKNKNVDKDDIIFYNAAIEAKAFLVTGNLRHFPQEKFIVSPGQFLSHFGKQQA